jgi:DNA-binding NarL/FixJ family response regulator
MCILLADGESNVRQGLRVLLEERPELEIAGQAANAAGGTGCLCLC